MARKTSSRGPGPRDPGPARAGNGRRGGRLSRQEWVAAAWEALQEAGIDGLRVDSLASTLEVTKGSFYAHFRDRADLLGELLDTWESRSTDHFVGLMDELEGSAWDRLLTILRELAHARILRSDVAFREWARRDQDVAVRVRKIDRRRITLIAQHLQLLGLEEDEAGFRAEMFYGWNLGRVYILREKSTADPEERLARNLRALRLLLPDGPGSDRPG